MLKTGVQGCSFKCIALRLSNKNDKIISNETANLQLNFLTYDLKNTMQKL
jgi:hypothetical protein